MNIISMLMILLTRRANRTRTAIGMRSLSIRTRITRIFIIAIDTDLGYRAPRLALEQESRFVNSKALNSSVEYLIILKECLSLLTFSLGVVG
jgi:hypothetical protein